MVRQRPATKVTFTLRPLPVQWGTPGRGCPPGLNFGADEVVEVPMPWSGLLYVYLLVEVPMPWSGLDGAEDLFTCVLDTGDYVGLVWYTFTLERLDGKNGEQLGPYQLTVYDGGEEVPSWFGEGMTYQIFPDRFRRTRIPDPTGMVGGRWVHAAWQDEPEYRPDRNGEIRNRDFFGGSLKGVEEKLDYLRSLGVRTLYFCPIFEAAENHRYGTADYQAIDPMLGTEEDFSHLCQEAHRRGMRVMLDGVFNHTGYVSRYFNGDGFYPEPGAHQSQDSSYYSWYNFTKWPNQYESWWGIYSLPSVNEHAPSYREFVFGGENSVVRRWLRAGADGWRLDVADELPDDFVEGIHAAARAEKADAVVIGEVWEDGSTKVAYGVRRKHILGRHCDGLMNYPFRGAALEYLQGGDAKDFMETMETLRENYPPFAFYSAMNSLGTHDTPRILTLLGVGGECRDRSREWRANFRMEPDQRRRGKELLKLGAALLFAFPAPPRCTMAMRQGWRALRIPSTAAPSPGGGRIMSCWAGLPVWGICGRSIPPCAGEIFSTGRPRDLCWPLPAPWGRRPFWPPLMPEMIRLSCVWRMRSGLSCCWGRPAFKFRLRATCSPCLLTLEVCCDCL